MKPPLIPAVVALLAALGPWAPAPRAGHVFAPVDITADSGRHDGVPGRVVTAFDEVIVVPGARWLRIEFAGVDLGRESTLTVESLRDGGWQTFDAETLAIWQHVSGVFNGDAVRVRLDVAPGDRDIRMTVRRAWAGTPVEDGASGPSSELCEDDIRVAASDTRVGRLWLNSSVSTNSAFCTAFRITNGALVTAGHCVDFDPDDFGPQLPDGSHDWFSTTVVEFNAPASDPDGTENAAAPIDQFPVDLPTLTWRYDGAGEGVGKDWAVFGVLPNASGLLPHEQYGLPFRVTRELPAKDATIRLTAHGSDSSPPGSTGDRNSQSMTLQTSTGAFLKEQSGDAPEDVLIRYAMDAEGGSSGGPVIWEALDVVFGIHTNSGCGGSSGISAIGTSMETDAFAAALSDYTAPDAEHVDHGHPLFAFQNGSILRPWSSLAAAVGEVGVGGVVSIVSGSYPQLEGNAIITNKPMTLVAPVGTVVIGH